MFFEANYLFFFFFFLLTKPILTLSIKPYVTYGALNNLELLHYYGITIRPSQLQETVLSNCITSHMTLCVVSSLSLSLSRMCVCEGFAVLDNAAEHINTGIPFVYRTDWSEESTNNVNKIISSLGIR